MQLKVLIPPQIFMQAADVIRIIAETSQGGLGLLPQRLDCVAALVPGILLYETLGAGIRYLAVDAGVLIKAGAEVKVSVRRAVAGPDLKTLHETVTREFSATDSQDRDVRVAVAKLECLLMAQLAEFQHGA